MPGVDLIKAFEMEIDRSLSYLLWDNEKLGNISVARHMLKILKMKIDYLKKSGETDKLAEWIIKGRIGKRQSGFDNTLILGEEGGLFMLLNNRDFLSESALRVGEYITESYLESLCSYKSDKGKIQITLGKGTSGKVRFSLILFNI